MCVINISPHEFPIACTMYIFPPASYVYITCSFQAFRNHKCQFVSLPKVMEQQIVAILKSRKREGGGERGRRERKGARGGVRCKIKLIDSCKVAPHPKQGLSYYQWTLSFA